MLGRAQRAQRGSEARGNKNKAVSAVIWIHREIQHLCPWFSLVFGVSLVGAFPGASHNYGGLSTPPVEDSVACAALPARHRFALAALLELARYPSGSLRPTSVTPLRCTRRRLPLLRSSGRTTRAWRILAAYSWESIQLQHLVFFACDVGI